MAGQIASMSTDDALLEDDYPRARKGKQSSKKAKKAPPKKFAKGKKAKGKKSGRDFRGMKNGVKDSGPGPSRIAHAMGAAPGASSAGSINC